MDAGRDDVTVTGTMPLTEAEGTPAAARRPVERTPPEWLQEARDGLAEPGLYLAYEDSGRRIVLPVAREWTRIGRSLAADVRFDDSTVSRRHALIVNQPDGVRVLDDRSLNGVYVNGERVEWSRLSDGDEIVVGRHSLWFLDATVTAEGESAGDAAPAAL
jgi:pSer/pThr/pTyr-binding forkhead associated (FHA) protein